MESNDVKVRSIKTEKWGSVRPASGFSSTDAEFTWRSRNVTRTPVPRSQFSSTLRYNLLVKETYWKNREAYHAARKEQTWNSYTVKAAKLATLIKRPRFDGTGKFLWYYIWPLLHNLATLTLAQRFKFSATLYTQVHTPSLAALNSRAGFRLPAQGQKCSTAVLSPPVSTTNRNFLKATDPLPPVPGPPVSVIWTVRLHLWQLQN
jgi:hypothetical protein